MTLGITDYDEPVLSPEQEQAVLSQAPALVVVASAGSGKTEVVARRIQRLLLAAPDDDSRVLALTYTVKAADELRARLRARLGALARRVDSDTIHGFCHSLIRTYGTRIGLPLEPELLTRDEDRVEVLRDWLQAQGEDTDGDLGKAFVDLDLLRARGQQNDLVQQWRSALAANEALDYPELLGKAVELLGTSSVSRQIRRMYSSIVVDEAQNLTQAQYDLLRTLAMDEGTITVPTMLVGDDKQSIVSFAGADPRFIDRFRMDFGAERIELTANYRSATTLASAANRVAARLGHAVGQTPVFAAQGLLRAHASANEEEEGAFVADWIGSLLRDGLPKDALAEGERRSVHAEQIAVLARAGGHLRFVAAALEQRGIAFAMSSTPKDWVSSRPGRVVLELVAAKAAPDHRSTYWEIHRLIPGENRPESIEAVSRVLSSSESEWLRPLATIIDLSDVEELVPALRRINPPPDASNDQLATWQADLEQISRAWDSFNAHVAQAERTWSNFKQHCARSQRGDDLAPGVRLLTVHKSQGREFAAVAVVGLNDGQFPDFRAETPEKKMDELRTFYVAITRPRRSLLLSRPRSRQTRYGPRAAPPSPFVSLVM